jgi:Flp pilus assembly protein CpaB
VNVVLALGVAALIACLGSVAAFTLYKRLSANAREGWNLVPVVVAAVDVEEGQVLTMDMISQRSIPEQFSSSSIVKPDSASYIVNQPLRAALQAGDPVRWTDMLDQKTTSMVLVARAQLDLGTSVREEEVEARAVDPSLITPTWVTQADLKRLEGRKVRILTGKGEPLLWSHFDTPGEQR